LEDILNSEMNSAKNPLRSSKKNRDLRERQDMEIHVATLNERGRIAREIHDNVGHLLTRSVLQVEAFQVVHAKDEQTRKEFEEVGSTVHEALDKVRESVHDLHADAFDLETQLKGIVNGCNELDIELEYLAENIPTSVGYYFVALTREAISNTLKHSTADSMHISALEQPGFYRLSINDNGTEKQVTPHTQGFTRRAMMPANKPGQMKSGIGLRSMEERVRNLNGFFRIDSSDGFRIVASIPRQSVGE
jgi:signal transduction histidine kinase